MNKEYGNWYYNEKKDKIMKWNPEYSPKNAEVIRGTKIQAHEYFGVPVQEGYGDLTNILLAHQLNTKFIPKTRAEMFDILMDSAKTSKYWIPEENRLIEVFKLINSMTKMRINYDDEIKRNLESKEKLTPSQNTRLFKMKKFEKEYQDYLED